jgi:hypothetical protein
MGRRQSNTSTYHFRRRGLKASRKGQAHKVSVHDHWFWINLADHKSKALLEVLNSLFYSQPGATKPGGHILAAVSPPPVSGALQAPVCLRTSGHLTKLR